MFLKKNVVGIAPCRPSCPGNNADSAVIDITATPHTIKDIAGSENISGSSVNDNHITDTALDIAPDRPSSTGNITGSVHKETQDCTSIIDDIAETPTSRFSFNLSCCLGHDFKQAEVEPTDEENDKILMRLLESELAFQIPESSVEQIKGSVGKVVQIIVQKVWESDKLQLKIQKLNPLTLSQPRILIVGSMKEGTRNYFPDEFDFLVTLAECDKSLCRTPLVDSVLETFHKELNSVLQKYKHKLFNNGISFSKRIRISGPASFVLVQTVMVLHEMETDSR